jgi:hypothetical protein
MAEMVCALHARVLKIVKNGMIVELRDDAGECYKIYHADCWACPDCGMEIVVLAPLAVAEHFEPSYQYFKDRVEMVFRY